MSRMDRFMQAVFVMAALFICFIGGGVAAHFSVFPFNLSENAAKAKGDDADDGELFSLPE